MLPAGGHVMQSQDNMVLPVGLGIVFVEWSGGRGRGGERQTKTRL
jgi:hypothetical protein